jgi:Tfp pilus assembly protein PilN
LPRGTALHWRPPGASPSRLQLPTQLYTAVLYTLITLLLFGQHAWYRAVKPRLFPKVGLQ